MVGAAVGAGPGGAGAGAGAGEAEPEKNLTYTTKPMRISRRTMIPMRISLFSSIRRHIRFISFLAVPRLSLMLLTYRHTNEHRGSASTIRNTSTYSVQGALHHTSLLSQIICCRLAELNSLSNILVHIVDDIRGALCLLDVVQEASPMIHRVQL